MIFELCRQEAIKLFSNRYPYLLLGIVFAVQAAYMIAHAATPPETTLDELTAPQLWADGAGVALRLELFIVLVLGAMGFSQEFAQGTVKTVLTLPIRRVEWVAAKFLSLTLLSWGLLLGFSLLGTVIVAFTVGWGDVVRGGVLLYTESQVWWSLATAVALTAVYLLPACAFALLISAFFNSSGAAVGVALVLAIVLEFGLGLLDQSAKFVFLQHLQVPVGYMGKMGKGLPYEWSDTLRWGLPVTLATTALLTGWLAARMERMDITD
jgi:ABC-type transport system involved in multi-copper enzyme maturation permease subunit